MKPINWGEPYNSYFKLLKSQRTLFVYQEQFKRMNQFLSPMKLVDVDKDGLNRYIANLRERGLKDSYIRNNMSIVHAFFKWLVLNEYRKDDPSIVFATMRVKPSAPAPKPLNKVDRERLKEALRWDTLGEFQKSLFILVGSTIGLRRFEICKILWADIDFDTNRIKGVGKGDKPFDLHIPPVTMAKLKEYGTLCDEKNKLGKYVFFSDDPDKPLPYHKPWVWSQEFKERLELPKHVKMSAHVLRHIFCSTIMESGKMTIDQAMKSSRHNDPQTLMRYVLVDKEEMAKKSDEIFG